jgi:hypothetical protein
MYWFGKEINSDEWKVAESWSGLSHAKKDFALTSLEDILKTLDGFSKLWVTGSKLYNEALPQLIKDSGFSEAEVHSTLSLLPGLLSRESLEARVKAEFTNDKVMDQFTKLPHFGGLIKAVPKGIRYFM